MSVQLTEKEFSKHLNTKFRINGDNPLELELTDVKGYMSKPDEETGMERFSAFFHGPGDRQLQQQVYLLEHKVMGTFDLFLVPIGRDEKGFRYEAVFNYFKDKAVD